MNYILQCLTHHLFLLPSTSQSVIVKSVERNAVNMYEAQKFLLGLESNGVSCSSPSVALNPATNVPSPSLICPVGLDILASAGLGLSTLGELFVYLWIYSLDQCFSNFQTSRSHLNSDSVQMKPNGPEYRLGKVQTKEPTESLESTLRNPALDNLLLIVYSGPAAAKLFSSRPVRERDVFPGT